MVFELFEKEIQLANTGILAVALLIAPFLFIATALGLPLAGSIYYFILVTYLGVITCGIKTYFNPKYFIGTVIFSFLLLTSFL
ncbi:hypothetical protein CXF71_09950 [Colwellia sp. 12G3]|nr:hypothetical protein CXF71_09950 [Colwellia sp. 12G3]